jgi:hypothetical protein
LLREGSFCVTERRCRCGARFGHDGVCRTRRDTLFVPPLCFT